jgi:type II secretory pathway predicted ATPase ExeA
MFLDFYALREQPFCVTPDPRYLYLSQTHREALASLVYGIESGRGFMALIGRSGMGKTTLLFQLLERWKMSFRTVYLFQTQCNSRELLRYLLYDLGIENPEDDLVRIHARLNQVLLQESQAGRRVVLFIDEAQNLQDSVLETVRLLSDFETPSAKLLQIVFSGQPELAEKLARPGLAQLRERIAVLSRLEPLGHAEIDHYIEHRLLIAGYKGSPLFTPGALKMIAERSEGIPRNINNFCFNALSLGYAMNRRTIDSSILKEVIADLDLEPLLPKRDIAPPSDAVRHRTLAQPKRGLARVALPAVVLACLLVLLGLFSNFFSERKPSHASSPPESNQKSLGEDSNVGRTLVVVVEPNETLEKISQRYLGQYGPKLTKEICGLNPELRDPNRIEIGQRIRLPRKPGSYSGDRLAGSHDNQVALPKQN